MKKEKKNGQIEKKKAKLLDFDKRKIKFKYFFQEISIIIIANFIISSLILLSKGSYTKASDFFCIDVFLQIFLSMLILTVILFTTQSYARFVKKDISRMKTLLILISCIAITHLLSIVFSVFVNIYLAPVVLSAMLVAVLLDKKVGILTSVLSSQSYFLIYWIIFGKDTIILSVGALLTSIIAAIFLIMLLDKARTRISFLVSSLIIGITTMFIPVAVNFLSRFSTDMPLLDILLSGVWSFLSIILASALFNLILPLMEQVFQINTTFRVAELTYLSHPLLKKLADVAPGTFHHSLVVGNLAELCADAIGEDATLAKACAYYHDIGKIKNPEFFIENQKGINPHDDVIPEVSVSMIVNHATLGYEILKEARMPDIIRDAAREHHGTTSVKYFLTKAQSYTEEHLDSRGFRYPGPKPKTKIAAILMIVDTVEAASRAMSDGSFKPEEFREKLRALINEKIEQDQFSDCDITFLDLKVIEDVLVETIPSMFHIRIKYDEELD